MVGCHQQQKLIQRCTALKHTGNAMYHNALYRILLPMRTGRSMKTDAARHTSSCELEPQCTWATGCCCPAALPSGPLVGWGLLTWGSPSSRRTWSLACGLCVHAGPVCAAMSGAFIVVDQHAVHAAYSGAQRRCWQNATDDQADEMQKRCERTEHCI